MKFALFFFTFGLTGCSVLKYIEAPAPEIVCFPTQCRVTYYSPHQDYWGWRNACPNTKRSVRGVTVAAHPKYPFGTRIYIPELAGVIGDGNFIVQDRGTAVTKKKASRGQTEVIDVFVRNNSEIRKYARKMPEYLTTYIYE